jgi:hypothetical protein
MIKSILIIINLSAVMLFSIFSIEDIVITHDGPKTLAKGETSEVKIIINKMDFSGPGRLKLNLSQAEGITISEKDSDGASFTFIDNEGLFIWYDLPSSKNIEITYLVTGSSESKGMKKISGTFSFINDNERKQIEIKSYIFEIAEKEEIAQAPPSVKSVRSIEKIDNYYIVKIHTTKGEHKGFARIKDKLPADYTAEAIETDGAVFKNIDGHAKFIWSDLAEGLESFTVSYKLQNNKNIDTSFSIIGEYASEHLIEEGYRSGIKIPISHYTKGSDNFVYNILENDTSKAEIVEQEEIILNDSTIEEITEPEVAAIEENIEPIVELIEQDIEPKTAAIEEEILVDNTINTEKVNAQINYKVQILAAHRIAGKEYFAKSFKFSDKFDLENHEGWVKYTTGTFNQYKVARDKRNNLSSHSFPGPFVTAYNNGERITVQEALIVSKQTWIQ